MSNRCRYETCTCTSDEEWSCLTTQWNQFDRPREEEQEKKDQKAFIEAVEKGDMYKAQKLLSKIKFKH